MNKTIYPQVTEGEAVVKHNAIKVTYSARPDVEREYLAFDVPNGWDDVKAISQKVLVYDGREFTFTGWNSDTLKCYFCRPLYNRQMDPTAYAIIK